MSPDRVEGQGKGRGAVVAVVGPSGAGKDTLIARAQAQLSGRGEFVFPRRTVTRDADPSAEDHDCLDAASFADAAASGAFCLTWSAHGLSYGLPASMLADVRQGRIVVANVSRTALAPLVALFDAVHVVEVTAAPDVLLRRIAARGRESEAEIAARIARSVALIVPLKAAGLYRIENSGSIETAVEAFCRLVLEIGPRPGVAALQQS